MNFEFLYLESDLNDIVKLDISKLDKLFLNIRISNNFIYIYPTNLELLQKLDPLKVVLVEVPQKFKKKFKRLQEQFIPIKEWAGPLLKWNTNYVYKNYNFINIEKYVRLPKRLVEGKTNIILSFQYHLSINDELRLLNYLIYVDLFIRPRRLDQYRSLQKNNDTYAVGAFSFNSKTFQYIQLIDGKVYLKGSSIAI